jgi:hypothetical protein
MSITFRPGLSEIFVERSLAVLEKSSQLKSLKHPVDKARISRNIWVFRVFAPAAGRDASVS